MPTSSFIVGTLSGLDLHRPACAATVSVSSHVLQSCCIYKALLLWHLSYPLAVTISLHPLFQSSLSPERRDLMKTSHLGLSMPRSLTFCTLFSCESLYLFPLWQKEASLMMAYKVTDL